MGAWRSRAAVGAAALLLALPAQAAAQLFGGVELDTVRAGRFDNGKMWTFEYPPTAWFREAYAVEADSAWLARARLSALRIPGCSASFVSPHGLVATNHHCVRGAITRVARSGETLLDSGFVAGGLAEERPIPDYWADQLIAIEDVSGEVLSALDVAEGEEARERARAEVYAAIEARARGRHAVSGDSVWVQIVPLYHGGRYSAYLFRRFTDVRLVVAVELQAGFFGGDPDNFTYPRYALDFAFLRVYRDGRPYRPEHHFRWGAEGVEPGQPVFVIGNPGSTNRLLTVAQLEYQRDVHVPALAAFLESRLNALHEYGRLRPEEAEALDIRNRAFGLSNSLKASRGRLAALQDPVILARRRDAERRFRDSLRADPELRERSAGLFERIAVAQTEKAAFARSHAAFLLLRNQLFASATLRRALDVHAWQRARDEGAPPDTLARMREEIASVGDQPLEMEARLLAERFRDFARYLGETHPITLTATGGGDPAKAARATLAATRLGDSARTAAALEGGKLDASDPALRLAALIAPAYAEYLREFGRLSAEESRLTAELGRLRFDVYGSAVPPDGTFSPRITDGVVRGYEYNGTLAPPWTTFYGMYDRYRSHGGGTDWALPGRWQSPPPGLELGTPLNFVSTADTYGGNSGSPAVTADLALVGLNFDRNIEGLSRDFIYLPDRGRNVMVDVRAVHAALDHAYEAHRIVAELESGRLSGNGGEADVTRTRSRGS